MRLVALVESPDHVCCRYRLAAFRPHLEAAGHTLDLAPLPRGWFGRLRLFHALRSADAVVLQRKLLPPLQLAALRRSARRLVFDFDDAVWLRDSYHPRGLTSRWRAGRFRRTVAAADLVVAGNGFLATAGRQAGADRVVTIPTCVDPADYPVATHAGGSGLRLVWVGSSSTLRGLGQARDCLAAVARAVPGARLTLICDRAVRLDPLPVELVRWNPATEARHVADADAGIAWMPDDDWSRGKCGLKLLQYHAAGLPVIANPVGIHRELVRDGETGLLASTAAEWVAAASRLAGDPGFRRQIGAAGRSAVESAFSVSVGGRLWVEVIDLLAGETASRFRRSG